MPSPRASKIEKKSTYCYQCVAGPDLLTVTVEDGVATACEPNFPAADYHPARGRCCVKAYGLVQKTYNPNRVLTPMKRTNPKKGRNEDPGFVAISWDEALDTVAAKLKEIRAKGLRDESGYPRLAATFGGGGTPTYYMGTFPAFLAAWGPVDFSFGSGQGVKCYHSEHLYGELWHRAFTVASDTPRCEYLVSFGANIEASGGVTGVWRHADARVRGMKRVQVEPHLSITGGCSAEWVPIRPKTDAAFLYAMIHVLLKEHAIEELDVPFLKHRTASPYLIAPNGFFLRDPETKKPLIWDLKSGRAAPHDTPGIDPALAGPFTASGIEKGADTEFWTHDNVAVKTAHDALTELVTPYTPSWAAKICDVPEKAIRRVANDFLKHARIGETIEIDGVTLPFRPVSIVLGKTVNNGWGGYECCWARTVLSCLTGSLEVPGGSIGTMVRLNRPATSRSASALLGEDGFMAQRLNPTDKEHWQRDPKARSGYNTLVPLVGDSPWSQALGPTTLAWMFAGNPPTDWPKPTLPDIWFIYRTNPAISNLDAPGVTERMAEFPFVVALTYTRDESNHMADILLPEATDFESEQLIRMGGTKTVETYWQYDGFAFRQRMVAPQGDAKDFTDIATELARRTELLPQYNKAINRGAAGVPLKSKLYDFSLAEDVPHTPEEIWNAACRSASAEITDGKESHGIEWFREHGFRFRPLSTLSWFLYPVMVEHGIRFELPYQERLLRQGRQLKNRLHEAGINWWDHQLTEYQALPVWTDLPGLWEKAGAGKGGDAGEFPFWMLTARSMQLAWGANTSLPIIREVAGNVAGHNGVIMNSKTAERLGVAEGDVVEIRSHERATTGRAVLREGIRPDTILAIGQFDHWVTPIAKDQHIASLNTLSSMDMNLTDATGSSADIARVQIKKIAGGRA